MNKSGNGIALFIILISMNSCIEGFRPQNMTIELGGNEVEVIEGFLPEDYEILKNYKFNVACFKSEYQIFHIDASTPNKGEPTFFGITGKPIIKDSTVTEIKFKIVHEIYSEKSYKKIKNVEHIPNNTDTCRASFFKFTLGKTPSIDTSRIPFTCKIDPDLKLEIGQTLDMIIVDETSTSNPTSIVQFDNSTCKFKVIEQYSMLSFAGSRVKICQVSLL